MARIEITLPEHYLFSTELPLYIGHINYGGHLDNGLLLTLGLIFSYTRAAWLSLIGAVAVYFILRLRVPAWVLVLGLVVGAAFAHNFGLASSAAGPTGAGKLAVVIGLAAVALIGCLNTFQKKA